MSISQNFPNIDPTLRLNFQGARRLDPRITFERASIGTYVDEDGLIKTAAADEARFDHNPETGESLGLLIEESRTNQYKYSNGGPIASTGNTTLTSNTTLTADPAGGNSASRIDRNLSGYAYQSINNSIGNSTIKTLSFWIKDNGSVNEAQVGTDGAGGRIYVNVDFSTSPPSLDWNSNNNNAIEQSLDIKEYPNGWYRVAMTFAGTQTPGYQEFQFMGVSDADYFIYGVQLEQASFATSYIPTGGSTITRQPDNASITGTNFSSWYNQPEGSYLFNAQTFKNVTGNIYYGESGNGAANRNIMYANTSSGNAILYYVENNNNPVNTLSAGYTFATNTFVKTAYCYKQNDFGVFATGGLSNFDTSGNIHTANSFSIGMNNINSGEHLNGHIKQLTYYPTRLTNTQLQNLTK